MWVGKRSFKYLVNSACVASPKCKAGERVQEFNILGVFFLFGTVENLFFSSCDKVIDDYELYA